MRKRKVINFNRTEIVSRKDKTEEGKKNVKLAPSKLSCNHSFTISLPNRMTG